MNNLTAKAKSFQTLFLFFLLSIGSAFANNQATPTISSFSPNSGPVGTLVTITGTNLDNPTAFSIGGVSAIVVSNSGTQLVGMVMPGATTGAISVTTTGGVVASSASFTQTPNSGNAFVQNGNNLVGTGAVQQSYQGNSISVSADGNTAIVGGWQDNYAIGAAWIYTRDGNNWLQQGTKLVGTGAIGQSAQGFSVSISADGNTAIVGGIRDNYGIGASWVFTRNGNNWLQQGNKLVGTGAIGAANQGNSVSLSADGNTAIVSGQLDNDGIGALWIFTRNGTSWTQQGNKLVGIGAIGPANQGFSVSISANGNTAIVGGYLDNNGIGASWIFTRNGTSWTQQGNKLVGTGATIGGAAQGTSVSISADGNTAIIGGAADGANAGIGASWIFTRNGASWTQQGNKLVGTGAIGAAGQGFSVSISADGNTAIVGGPIDNFWIGSAWIFKRNGNNWIQQGNKLGGTGVISTTQQGSNVSISADGKTIFIGGPYYHYNDGAVWTFDLTTSTSSITSFTPSTGPVGTLVTINGTGLTDASSASIGGVPAIVISKSATKLVAMVMPGAANGLISLTSASGVTSSASSFTVTPTRYPNTQQGNKLVARDAYGGLQGSAVSVSADGNTAIVGLPIENGSKGNAVVYTRTGTTWIQQGNKLTVTGAAGTMQSLGTSVSISADGNTAVLGAPDDNSGVGAAWVFTRTAGVWSQQGTKLIGTGAVGNARQGTAVSISGDGNTVVVGGIYDNGLKGALWVFSRTADTWTQVGNKLVGNGNYGAPQMGTSVAISADGATIIAGGPFDFASRGASWIFTKTGSTWSQQGSKLAGTGTTGNNISGQGTSVALSADGNTAIVGSKYDNAGKGAVWIFTRSSGGWAQQGNKLTGASAIGAANYGDAVGISADGNTAIVGGWNDNPNGSNYASGKGANWVYTRSGSVWTLQGSKLIGAGASGNASQGFAVALSADGTTAISGAPMDLSGVGAAWVYIYQTPVAPTGIITTENTALIKTEDLTGLSSKEITVYPNPSTGRFTVSFKSPVATTLTLSIVEAGTGRSAYSQSVNAIKGDNQVPVTMQRKQNLSTYILMIEGASVKYESKKLLIDK